MVPNFFLMVFFSFLECLMTTEGGSNGQRTLRESKSCLNAKSIWNFRKSETKIQQNCCRWKSLKDFIAAQIELGSTQQLPWGCSKLFRISFRANFESIPSCALIWTWIPKSSFWISFIPLNHSNRKWTRKWISTDLNQPRCTRYRYCSPKIHSGRSISILAFSHLRSRNTSDLSVRRSLPMVILHFQA